MTATRTTGVAVAPIPATTPTGQGTIVPIVKAIWHLLLVREVLVNKWEMTLADAVKEIEEASLHVNAATWLPDLMTAETDQVLKTWKANMEKHRTTVAAVGNAARSGAKAVGNLNEPEIKALVTESWQLLARLDLEYTGLPATAVDPGTAR